MTSASTLLLSTTGFSNIFDGKSRCKRLVSAHQIHTHSLVVHTFQRAFNLWFCLFVCALNDIGCIKLEKRKSCNTHELMMLKSIRITERCTSDVFAWLEMWKTKHELCLQPVAPHHNTFRFHNSACLFIYVCSLFGYPADVECTNIALLNNEFKAPLCVFMKSPVPTEIFFRSEFCFNFLASFRLAATWISMQFHQLFEI